MVAVDLKILLNKAAAASFARIAQDHEEAPEALQPLVSFIGHNLFDPRLRVSYLRTQVAGVDSRMLSLFGAAVGSPPFRYIEDRRMETACRLLTETRLRVWQISDLLGYSSSQVFSRAFARCYGTPPTIYRQTRRRRTERFSIAGVARRYGVPPENLLQLFARGELEAAAARIFLDRLRYLYPDSG